MLWATLSILLALVLPHVYGHVPFFYGNITSTHVPVAVANSCISSHIRANCTVYKQRDVNIDFECGDQNVLRIKGEYKTLRIICNSDVALDFRYHGIQPTEAIKVEWYKEISATNSEILSFGVDVEIQSVDSLFKHYREVLRKTRGVTDVSKIDYPRSGRFIFRGIYDSSIETSFFIYLEDNGKPSFLRNLETRITLRGNQLFIPCVASHMESELEVTFQGQMLNYSKSTSSDQGVLLDQQQTLVGDYVCSMKALNFSDKLTLTYTNADSENDKNRFGIRKAIPKQTGHYIKYSSKELYDRRIRIQISCKITALGSSTFLAGIEAENFAAMNLKREFVFPNFVNRSYSALYIRTDGSLSFEVLLPDVFKTRYGGSTYCQAEDLFEVEEFAVPFVGDVSKRVFDTDWTKFRREQSNVRIHFELNMLTGNEKPDSDEELHDIYSGTTQTFVCKFIVAIVVKPCIWYTVWRNGNVIQEMIDYNWTEALKDHSYFKKVVHEDLVGVICSATFYYASFWRNISMPLNVTAGTPPKIETPQTKLTLREGTLDQGIRCVANGRPKPKVSWFKGGDRLHAIEGANGTLLYQITKVSYSHSGSYTCVAENVYGKDEKIFNYTVEGDDVPYLNLIGIPLAVFLLTLTGAAVYIKFFRKERTGLTRAEVEEFLAGEKGGVRQSTAFAHEFAHQCPYDSAFELTQNKFQIDLTAILGSGAYGIVLKGVVEGRPVAVKTTKKNADKAYLKALLSELKIMIYLGYHENIVQLVGASTKDLDKGSVFIFVQFCGMGNLEKYLRTNRNYYEGDETDYTNLGGDLVDRWNVFSYKDLITWACQIADGMEYLGSQKVIHGDLAARNILLTDNKQTKITDFGLSRQLYGYASYVKKHQEPLPWRWMAIESLRDLSFSTMSDIWAYGILLWEIFSLGEVPYPGMAWTLDFVDELENGLRMSRPKRAPEIIYTNVLYLCWHKVPSLRPSFTSIREILEGFRSGHPEVKNEKSDDKKNTVQNTCTQSQTRLNVYTNL